MRPGIGCLCLILAWCGPALGHAQEENPRALIERGIKAMGGEIKPGRYPAIHAHFHVTFRDGQHRPFESSGEIRYQSTSRLRLDLRMVFATDEGRMSVVLDGNKVWQRASENKKVEEISASDLPNCQTAAHFVNPFLLPSLLTAKGVTLSSLPVALIEGQPANGVKATLHDGTAFQLFFDKKSGLLISKSATLKDGKEDLTLLLSDYQEPGVMADERTLQEAGLATDGPKLLEYLRKQTPDPAKVARAAALVKQLGDESYDLREKASQDLVALGGVSIPHLERALKDDDPEIVRRAKACLERTAVQNNERVLTAAIRQLARDKFQNASEVLLKLLPGANEATAQEAMAALFALAERDPTPDTALVKALKDNDPVIRAAAAAVLGTDSGAYLRQTGRRLYIPGLKQPMTLKRLNGRGTVLDVIEVREMRYVNQFDPKLFAKP